MKKVFLIIVLMLLFTIKSNAQTISTNEEVYNYDIGDIFHYKHEIFDSSNWFLTLTNIKITGKYYSFNQDTLYFFRDIALKEEGSNIQVNFLYFKDTVFYTDLNLPVNLGFIDSVYYDSNLYNGRKINMDTSHNSIAMQFADSLGKVYDLIEYDFSANRFNEWKLVYYKKGNEDWGIAIPLFIINNKKFNSIAVYPNPAIDNIGLSFEQSPNEDLELSIFSSLGTLVKQQQLRANIKEYRIDIQDLSPGIYFIRLKSTRGSVFSSKFIKQ